MSDYCRPTLSLATLGLPGMPLDEVADLAAAHGFTGLELRCAPDQPVHTGLDPAARRRVVRMLDRAGVRPLTVAGYVGVAEPGDDEPVLADLRAQVRLAADLGAPFARVFPRGGERGPAADDRAVRRLAAAAPQAADLGVRLLLETHDSHSGGADVARVLAAVDHPAAGALWDVMHTWLSGETVAQTHAALAPWLGYVQVKDVAGAEDRTPLALGAGVLPIGEAIRALPRDTWISWEYEAAWYPAAADLAVLLPAAADLLRALAS